MKWYLILGAVILFASAFAEEDSSSEESDPLPLAKPCDEDLCKLPNCRCSNTEIPGGLRPRDTPQFVQVTFDDGVNIINIQTYRDLLYNKINSKGCPAGATFYVSHEYTNYQLINELYNNGFEIALHSITHRSPTTFWAEATYQDMKEEFADQRLLMSHFANIPFEEMKGVRHPFLQMPGNNTFHVMHDYNLTYDSSWPTISFTNPGLWPYTLDYASIQDCSAAEPCPTASIPGVWISPMISWFDVEDLPCAMADACFYTPDMNDEQAWFEFIVKNFESSYLGNRAPFGFYVHEAYLASHNAVLRALVRFIDLINNLDDVFMVNTSEVIDWVKNPKPIDEYRKEPCRVYTRTDCPNRTCELRNPANNLTYWMTACNVCPAVYPWIGNPLGQAQ